MTVTISQMLNFKWGFRCSCRRCFLNAAKYEIQKPSTCRATLFRCKFVSMFSVFHVTWSTCPAKKKTFVFGRRNVLRKVERWPTLSNKFWLYCSSFIELTTCHATNAAILDLHEANQPISSLHFFNPQQILLLRDRLITQGEKRETSTQNLQRNNAWQVQGFCISYFAPLTNDDGNCNGNATNQWYDWLNKEKYIVPHEWHASSCNFLTTSAKRRLWIFIFEVPTTIRTRSSKILILCLYRKTKKAKVHYYLVQRDQYGIIARHLRTVPTIVTAHTFCTSPDTRISYRQCLLIQGYFCAV